MDGGDIASQFQADSLLLKTPILFLTAAVKKKEIDQSAGYIGGFPFVAKPVEMDVLITAIEKALIAEPRRV